jgi:hypothetical protein
LIFSNEELADMHFMYCSADGNVAEASRLYQGRCPYSKTFISNHRPLCEYENFAPRAANNGRSRPKTPEVEENILDIVNETPGISKRVSVQVSVAQWIA